MTDAGGFTTFETWIAKVLACLNPAERQGMFRAVTQELLKRNRARITRQISPDGTAWSPRKRGRNGQVRKKAKMMVGLRAARRMKGTTTPEGCEVGWSGRDARIALVHQHGERDHVDRRKSAAKVRYPIRTLIGLPDDDKDTVRSIILERFSHL